MQLISELAAGIRGAEGGTFVAKDINGVGDVVVYDSFNAASGSSGSHSLDANGGAVAYVSALCQITVYDANGVLVRGPFTPASFSASMEIRHPRHTGVDWDTQVTALGKPLTHDKLLDDVYASFGGPDWKVLVEGSNLLLQDAIGICGPNFVINVKNGPYLATGNGIADDAVALNQALVDAKANGYFVFLPPGTYRITSTVTAREGVRVIGAGTDLTFIEIDAASTTALQGEASASKSFTIEGCTIRPGQAHTGNLWAGSASKLVSRNCVWGTGTFTQGRVFNDPTGIQELHDTGIIIAITGTGSFVTYNDGVNSAWKMRGGYLLMLGTGGGSSWSPGVNAPIDSYNVEMHDVDLRVESYGGSTSRVTGLVATRGGRNSVTGCRFYDPFGVSNGGIYGDLVSAGAQLTEAGNQFYMDLAYYFVTQGPITSATSKFTSYSLDNLYKNIVTPGATTVFLESEKYSKFFIEVTSNTSVTISVASMIGNPAEGREIQIQIYNTASGLLTVTFNTSAFCSGTLDVPVDESRTARFTGLPRGMSPGRWTRDETPSSLTPP